jgi:hypothetical protein
MGMIKKVLIVSATIFTVLVLVLAAGLFYLYEYHVFKTIRICIPPDAQEMPLYCVEDSDCIAILNGDEEKLNQGVSKLPEGARAGIKEQMTKGIIELEVGRSRVPGFFHDTIDEVLEKSLICSPASANLSQLMDKSCKMKQFDFSQIQTEVDSCKPGEEEIVREIRGKDGIALLEFARDNPEVMASFQ